MTPELVYILDVKSPDQSPRKLVVHDFLLAGLDPRNDLVLMDSLISPKHFHFKSKNGLLSLHFLGETGSTTLNNLPLEHDKHYLLDSGDTLKCGRIQIRIRQDLEQLRPVSEKKHSVQLAHQKEFLNENFNETHLAAAPTIAESPEKPEAAPVKNSPPKKNEKVPLQFSGALKLIPYKIYSFVFDVAFTYFILTFAIPSSGVLEKAQAVLYPMTEFFNRTLVAKYPEISQYKILSFLEFFIVFHILMITSALIIANSPGAFLLGLRPSGKSRLGNRFSAYLYALMNVLLLPLVLFDIPLYRGRNAKEWLTFNTRDLAFSPIRKIFRTTIVPSLILFFILSPLFLKFPFATVVVEEKLVTPKFKDVHVRLVSSLSSVFGTELKSELNSQYSLLPLFAPGRTGMTLFDHVTGKSLIVEEEWRMKTQEALFKLRYGNPLSSLYLPNEEMSNELLKTRAFSGIMISPLQFAHGFTQFGLFLGNGLLFKSEFLKNFTKADTFTVTAFDEKNPFLLITSSSEQMLFWFTPKEIIAFRITAPKQTKLLDHFTRDILAGMRFTQAYGDKLKTPEILETMEAFEKGNHQTLLTYYIYEAKNQIKLDQAWRSFLKKNILQTKLALNGNTNKNIEKSFDDILKTLP